MREWEYSEFTNLLHNYNFQPHIQGLTISDDINRAKKTILAISGQLAKPKKPVKLKKVLAIIACYNDEDIIAQVIASALAEDVDVRLIDNWSFDNTWSIISNIARQNSRVEVERFPADGPSDDYEWEKILNHKALIAKNSGYDWAIHWDSDDLRESPWEDFNLVEAISAVDELGYNAIDHIDINFRPTDKNYSVDIPLDDYFTHFEFYEKKRRLNRINCWKCSVAPDCDLAIQGGHEVVFTGRKVFPLKFIYKHYPFRSPEQIRNKFSRDRYQRVQTEHKTKNWHSHFAHLNPNPQVVWKKEDLIPYEDYHKNFIVERLSGIGIA